MNGPDHYLEAERLLDSVEGLGDKLAGLRGLTTADAVASMQMIVAQAQVHAALAQVAATIETCRSPELGIRDVWREAVQ